MIPDPKPPRTCVFVGLGEGGGFPTSCHRNSDTNDSGSQVRVEYGCRGQRRVGRGCWEGVSRVGLAAEVLPRVARSRDCEAEYHE